MTQKDKRASLHTIGCRLNQAETTLLQERLEAAGYAIVPFGEPADLGIVNTCTVTNEADVKSRKLIRAFIRKNPRAYMAVIGCYSQTDAASVAEIDGVDLILGNQEKLNVLDYAAEGKNETPLIVRDRILRDDFTIALAGETPFSRRANLKIQDGCDFMCTFCVIPFARGRSRSREMDNLLDEARQLVARGAKELVLTGVNVGTYEGRRDGSTLADVIEGLNEIPDLRRIRISSIEPTTIPESVFGMMNDPNHALLPYLHIPLQSGSNRVLESMGRRYTREEYLDFIERADAAVQDLCIGTDIMVGAAGEGEDDFEDTCELLDKSPLAYAHVFKYSERAGTASARLPGKVDAQTAARRSARIRRISAEKLRRFHGRHLGKTFEVLFEQVEKGHSSGYTGNYIRVAVRSDDILENSIREVTIEESRGDFVVGHCNRETHMKAFS